MFNKTRRNVLAGIASGLSVAMLGHGRINQAMADNNDSASHDMPVEHHVEILDFEFSPKVLSVKPDDTITWINRDIAPHTATALDKSWDTGEIKNGQSKSIVVRSNMLPDYYCRFHPVMEAKLSIIDK